MEHTSHLDNLGKDGVMKLMATFDPEPLKLLSVLLVAKLLYNYRG